MCIVSSKTVIISFITFQYSGISALYVDTSRWQYPPPPRHNIPHNVPHSVFSSCSPSNTLQSRIHQSIKSVLPLLRLMSNPCRCGLVDEWPLIQVIDVIRCRNGTGRNLCPAVSSISLFHSSTTWPSVISWVDAMLLDPSFIRLPRLSQALTNQGTISLG